MAETLAQENDRLREELFRVWVIVRDIKEIAEQRLQQVIEFRASNPHHPRGTAGYLRGTEDTASDILGVISEAEFVNQ